MSTGEAVKEYLSNLNEEDCQRRLKELSDNIEKATGVKPHLGQAPDDPDYPPCNTCGKEFGGKLSCSRCQCVFYCSRECQQKHWKVGGHKAECKTLEQKCINTAKMFVSTITDKECFFEIKASADLWSSLDGDGVYKKALELNVNGAIEQLMEDEIKNAKDRFLSGTFVSVTQMLMCTPFRGGRNIPGGVFSGMDAHRIKKYVHSSDVAFERWFEASLKIISIFQTQAMDAISMGNDTVYWCIQKIARDIAAAWGMVFTNSKASKAILLRSSKEADDNAHVRAKWIFQKVRKVITKFPPGSPDNGAIEGQLNTFTAMIQIRLKEFGVDVGDIVSLLSLKGTNKQMYEGVAMVIAEATIKKGRQLTTVECQQVLMSHTQLGITRNGRDSTSTGLSSSGKKKGKKKRK